jgi:glycosyltransferase involved in cell wall biosynthesis
MSSPPAIAIISNSHTPYRLALHRRIAAEIPQIKLFSVYTHSISNSNWRFEVPEEIGPMLFGTGENSENQDKLSGVVREWRRGGRIIRWMKQQQIRFVVMMGYNDAGRLRIIRWCRRNRVPCFLFGDSNIHGDRRTGFKALVKRILVGWVMRTCTGVFPCGSVGREYFLKYGADPNRIFYFPYEPDYALIENLPAEKIQQVCRRFNFDPQRNRLVYSGRLIAIKRIDLLIKAFVATADQRPNWDLVVVGDGPKRKMLEGMVPVELSRRVIWTGFVDDQPAISAVYRASDVLVLPSDFEPWALVINEAAAAGMAIISSSVVGAAAELVRDGVNGKLFPPGDLAALSQAMLEVTDENRIGKLKAGSKAVLADWRCRGDPVTGLVNALKFSGTI